MSVNFWWNVATKLDSRDSINFLCWDNEVHIRLTRKLTPNDYISAAYKIPILELRMATNADAVLNYNVDACISKIAKEEQAWRASQSAPPMKSSQKF